MIAIALGKWSGKEHNKADIILAILHSEHNIDT